MKYEKNNKRKIKSDVMTKGVGSGSDIIICLIEGVQGAGSARVFLKYIPKRAGRHMTTREGVVNYLSKGWYHKGKGRFFSKVSWRLFESTLTFYLLSNPSLPGHREIDTRFAFSLPAPWISDPVLALAASSPEPTHCSSHFAFCSKLSRRFRANSYF